MTDRAPTKPSGRRTDRGEGESNKKLIYARPRKLQSKRDKEEVQSALQKAEAGKPAGIDKWISELPDSRLDEIHDTASRVFQTAAWEYLADRMKTAAQRAVDESIISEMKRHNQET